MRRARAQGIRARPNFQRSGTALVYTIPDCAEHYFDALVDPFDAQDGVCLPAGLFPLPSYKVKVFARTRFTLGTSGIGFAAFTPSLANDSAVLQLTGTTSVGTTAAAFNTFTNLVNVNCTQLPYTTAQVATTKVVSGRLVAAGLRLKYVGPLANRNGTVIMYEDPDHLESRAYSFDTLGSSPYSAMDRVGPDEWDAHVCYSGPVTTTDIEYVNTAYPLGSVAPIIIACSGVAGDLYEAEAYEHIEYIGTQVASKTPSHADSESFGHVVEGVKSITAVHPLKPTDAPSLWEKVKGLISDGLPQIVSTATQVGKMIVGSKADLLRLGMSVMPAGGGMSMGHSPPLLLDKGHSFHKEGSRTMNELVLY